jgi:phage shock protein PspC (stress-responsive transcriptional regulator)
VKSSNIYTFVKKRFNMVQRTGLFRGRTNRVIGGVASGIAYNLNTDPTLIRIIFILLAIFWGGGVLLYLILWIALPEEDIPPYNLTGDQPQGEEGQPDDASSTAQQATTPYPVSRPSQTAPLVLGLILIAVGAAFLVERFIPRIDFGHLWPFILVVAGLVLILSNFTGTKKSDI